MTHENGRDWIDAYDLETGRETTLRLSDVERLPPPKTGIFNRPERLRMSTTYVRDKKTGRLYVDIFKRFAKPYWLTTEPREITLAAPTLASPFIMPIDRQGPLEIDYSYAFADGDFTITFFDPQNRPLLMNREIHRRTIMSGFNTLGLGGPAGRPLIWPDPWFLWVEEGKRNLVIGLRDLSGLPENKVRIVLHGRRFYHQHSPKALYQRYSDYYKNRPVTMPFFQTTEQIAAVSGAAGTETDFDIRITDEADQIFYKMMAVSGFPFEFQLIEKSYNRPLMNDFIRVDNGFGDAELPHILFEPTYFEAGHKLILRIRKLTADNDIIWPTWACLKVFRSVSQIPLGVR